jgi:hypothetical protein
VAKAISKNHFTYFNLIIPFDRTNILCLVPSCHFAYVSFYSFALIGNLNHDSIMYRSKPPSRTSPAVI